MEGSEGRLRVVYDKHMLTHMYISNIYTLYIGSRILQEMSLTSTLELP